MNLYIRYFNNETLVNNADAALDFLRSIPEINVTPELEADLKEYAESNVMFPKRYKVRSHIYFIVIKTTAETMADFKAKKALRQPGKKDGEHFSEGDNIIARLNQDRPGWYEGEVNFKRVVLIPETGKHEYRDTTFVADVKANSGIDCYNRIVDYLRDRVDYRSQFPSAKGKNFHFKFLGLWK
ncbi:MAG: hypothetical protein SPE56_02385 [Prevotella sp.]|jgi:hypothetical protein|nr:hypothetical protein [Prevotella sp.]